MLPHPRRNQHQFHHGVTAQAQGNTEAVLLAVYSEVMGKEHLEPEFTGKYRVGDIRHCFADISLARRELGYEPRVSLEDGLRELVGWLEEQVAEDHAERASAELSSRGLTV